MNKFRKTLLVYVLIAALVVGALYMFNGDKDSGMKEIKTSTMVTHLKENDVEKINVTETKLTAELKSGEVVYTYVNSVVDMNYLYENYIMPQVDAGTLKLQSDPPKEPSPFMQMLPTLLMIGIMVFFFVLIMRQSGGGGKAMQFGKSRAKMAKKDDLKKITFKDVAGLGRKGRTRRNRRLPQTSAQVQLTGR